MFRVGNFLNHNALFVFVLSLTLRCNVPGCKLFIQICVKIQIITALLHVIIRNGEAQSSCMFFSKNLTKLYQFYKLNNAWSVDRATLCGGLSLYIQTPV